MSAKRLENAALSYISNDEHAISKAKILVEMMALTKTEQEIDDTVKELMDQDDEKCSELAMKLLENLVRIKGTHTYLNYLYSIAE